MVILKLLAQRKNEEFIIYGKNKHETSHFMELSNFQHVSLAHIAVDLLFGLF